MIVCICNNVNEQKITDAVQSGCRCIEDLKVAVPICNQCEQCKPQIQELIHAQLQTDRPIS